MIFSQLVLLPLLLVLSWGYVAVRPACDRTVAMVVFDGIVLILAVSASLTAHAWLSGLRLVPDNSIWATVMATISTFHIFPAVLLVGWYVRRLLFAPKTSAA